MGDHFNAPSINRPVAPSGRDEQAFATLTDEHMNRIKTFGSTETLPAGAIVFERGQRNADFYALIDGCIEIFDYNCEGEIQVFTTHCERQFTGEIDLFSNRKVLVGGRTGRESRVIKLNREQFRQMLAGEPDIGDIVIRAFILRRLGILEGNLGGSMLIGCRNDPETLRIRTFLSGNGYPTRTLYLDDDDMASEIMKKHNADKNDLPIFLCHGEEVLKRPTIMQVAETVGIVEWPDSQRVYDLAVIGGGPGGMATAVYGASEGLDTVVLERQSPGGQASTSSKIENYLGFPTGLSGQELAGRAQIQAQKFGATLALPMNVTKIEGDQPPYKIHVDGSEPIQARSIVIASGATYRTLNIDNASHYEGRGIHYAATALEAGLCDGEEVVVVGGGNSAGQAAVFLASRTKHVHMLIRGEGLANSMSDYLIRRIEASSSITLHKYTEIVELGGEYHLESVTCKNRKTHETTAYPISHIFLMIGAVPNTNFLDDSFYKDENGFVCTGIDVVEGGRWSLDRKPEVFETSRPSIFAIGDVRAKSVKRVASAVGEGSICVQFVHRLLAER